MKNRLWSQGTHKLTQKHLHDVRSQAGEVDVRLTNARIHGRSTPVSVSQRRVIDNDKLTYPSYQRSDKASRCMSG